MFCSFQNRLQNERAQYAYIKPWSDFLPRRITRSQDILTYTVDIVSAISSVTSALTMLMCTYNTSISCVLCTVYMATELSHSLVFFSFISQQHIDDLNAWRLIEWFVCIGEYSPVWGMIDSQCGNAFRIRKTGLNGLTYSYTQTMRWLVKRAFR